MFESYSTDPVFNVKAMVHQTGVAAATLRAWERRYGMPSPPRTGSGYRLYSARDVAIIRWLKGQIEAGLSISQAVALLHTQIGQPETGRLITATVVERLPASLARLHDDILEAATAFNEDGIEAAFSEAFSLFPVEDVCINLMQPVMITLGARWHAGEISISTEHFVTNLIRRRLITLLSAAPASSRPERIVSACAPGEYHELGLLMVSVFLRRQGFGVIYLGQNTPPSRMTDMLQQTQPDVVMMTATQLRAASNLLTVYESFNNTRLNPQPVFAYGGRIFNSMPSLRERVPGVFFGEHALEVVDRILQMIGNRSSNTASNPPSPRPETRDALQQLRQRRAEIVSRASTRITQDAFEFNTVAHKYERALEASDRLYEILDAAMNFDEASVLADATYWEWDAFAPDGVQPEQLNVCASHVLAAVRECMPTAPLAVIEPFLNEMGIALHS
jgi:methanogenic corrinoid protein MtbC1